jgi:hypothetical protein
MERFDDSRIAHHRQPEDRAIRGEGKQVGRNYAELLSNTPPDVHMIREADNVVRNLIRPSWTLSWAYKNARYSHHPRQSGLPLIIYQMGKVGSTSVTRALRSLSPTYSVYGVHTLRPDKVELAIANYRKSYSVRRLVPEHLLASRLLVRDLAKGQPRGRWKVITIVRDPIARNISSFFQDIELRHPSFQFSERVQHQSTPDLVNDLTDLFMSAHDHDEPIEWFERELGSTLKIDVYGKPFHWADGFQTYHSDRADLLLFRLEDIERAWAPGVSTLLETSASTALPKTNVGSRKPYAELYEQFKDCLVLPNSYVERMYTSRFARHFYRAAELERWRTHWASKFVSFFAYASSSVLVTL